MSTDLNDHYDSVIKAIINGKIIPFFGAGVNMCDRQKGEVWRPGSPFLPSGAELAEHLSAEFNYRWSDRDNLLRVSQYVVIKDGLGALYGELRKLFDADYKPTTLHKFFATLPATLSEKGYSKRGLLVVTTNYDDLMERAFKDAGEEFDIVTYEAVDKQQGKFWHWPPKGNPSIIKNPKRCRDLTVEKRSIILKIHGAIDRQDPNRDSFVITDDNYIDYLTRADISSLVPIRIASQMSNSPYLFLGYSLRDWNLRVILHRIWKEQRLSWKSWAILLNPQLPDEQFWKTRNVDVYNALLKDYIAELDEKVKSLPNKEN